MTSINGFIYGHNRRKTTVGDDASESEAPMGLLNDDFALKKTSGKAKEHPPDGRKRISAL
jgi:hypothetical protein